MKTWKALCACGVVAIVSAIPWVAFGSAVPEIDESTADRLAATADGWCTAAVREVPPGEWTVEVQQLRPQAVKVTPDGVYIEQRTRFAESQGVFVLRSGSTFQPANGTDPSFRPLRGRVYWYEVKG